MIAHYYMTPYESPEFLASEIIETAGILVRDNHQKSHRESVDESTRIHRGDKSYKLNEFLQKFYYQPRNFIY